MGFVHRILPLVALVLLSSAAAPLVDAQPRRFQEVPIPDEPAPVYIGPGSYYSGIDVIIRAGQNGVRFDLGTSRTTFFKVRVDGGPWTFLLPTGSPAAGEVYWSPSESVGSYRVDVEFGRYTVSTYSFDLIVMPPAQRAYVSTESTIHGPLEHSMLVWQGGTGLLDQPVLVVEGIDGDNENPPEAYYALGSDPQAPLFPRAQAAGADIVVLDFGDGGRTLEDNAAVVREALWRLRRDRTDRRRSLDVIGVSMGGVVARYALAEMEEDGVTHSVGTFLSVDAPQQGAVIDRELQGFIRNNLEWPDYPASLARPAGQQLLVYNLFTSSSPTAVHDEFYGRLRALNDGHGYPRRSQNVGVSFGTPDPNPGQGRRWARLEVDGACQLGEYPFPDCDDREFFVSGDHAQPGSFLPIDVTQLWGQKLGGAVTYELLRFPNEADPTFIPFASALDRVGSRSAFDEPLIHLEAGQEPSYHDVVPPALISPLLRRLGYETPPPARGAISGPTFLTTGERGYWRATAGDPGDGYQFIWKYRVFTPECDDPSTASTLPCGVWHMGPESGAVFSFESAGALRVELKVRASDGTWSPIHNVSIEYSGGGPVPLDDAHPAPTSVAENALRTTSSDAVALDAVTPNPLGGGAGRRASVPYSLPTAGEVRVTIHDALGREVARPVDGRVDAGRHVATFDAGDLPAGVYVVRLVAGSETRTRLVTFLR